MIDDSWLEEYLRSVTALVRKHGGDYFSRVMKWKSSRGCRSSIDLCPVAGSEFGVNSQKSVTPPWDNRFAVAQSDCGAVARRLHLIDRHSAHRCE
jgi:hypothetical protein